MEDQAPEEQQLPEVDPWWRDRSWVWLLISVGAWCLVSVGVALQTAQNASGSSSYKAGAFAGRLLGPLIFAFVIRGVLRLLARDPIVRPAWTPGLFLGAALISVFETLQGIAH